MTLVSGAYASGEGGYAIRFDIPSLVAYSKSGAAFLTPVTYDLNVQRQVADDVVNATLSLFDDAKTRRGAADMAAWITEFLRVWADAAAYVAPLLKHPAFQAENEWRVIRRLSQPDIPKLKYRQRSSMLSRQLPLTFEPPVAGQRPKLPIAEIMVGPARHKASSRITVGDMLRTIGYPDGKVTVTISEVPYRAL